MIFLPILLKTYILQQKINKLISGTTALTIVVVFF